MSELMTRRQIMERQGTRGSLEAARMAVIKRVPGLVQRCSLPFFSRLEYYRKIHTPVLSYLTNSLVAEPEGSTPLIPNPAIGHDPEPVPSISRPHSPFL
jgi:hypothetical protein